MTDIGKFDVDVLVVGSGPTGGTLALALAQGGIRVHVVTRSHWLADTPRAHITNQRTMEVFRDLGLQEEIERYATPWDLMGDTMFATSLAGDELMRMRTWGTGDARRGDYVNGSPCGLVDLIQPKLEPLLVKEAAAAGATFAFQTEYLRHDQDDDGVTVHLRDKMIGHEYTLRCRYLIAADGARSRIVEHLDLPIEGHMSRAGTVYTNFEADLTRYVAHRPSILNWIVTPAATFGEIGMGMLRAVVPWTQWIVGWGFDMKQGEPDMREETCLAKIRSIIGDDETAISIKRVSVWYVNQAYATAYSKGRVFCAGDAVHRHPPSSGLGMNTCVQDAFNLAWKLTYVIHGHAGPALLESYSSERASVGRQIVLRANQSRRDYSVLNDVFRVANAPNPVEAGIARLRDPGPEGIEARVAMAKAIDLKNTEFNAQGVEMNQRYMSGAVIPDFDTAPEAWLRDPELYLQPTTRPGAKIPHVWLVGVHGQKRSTLDVTGRGRFTLLTGIAGRAWVTAAQTLALPFLDLVIVGEGNARDLYLDWQRLREIAEDGAMLIRPDGHVAWRSLVAPGDAETATAMLRSAIDHVLDRISLAPAVMAQTNTHASSKYITADDS